MHLGSPRMVVAGTVQGRAQLAQQRRVVGQRDIGAVEYADQLVAAQQARQLGTGEGVQPPQTDHADLEPRPSPLGFPQSIRRRLGDLDGGAHREQHQLGVVEAMRGDAAVGATGEFTEAVHRRIEQPVQRCINKGMRRGPPRPGGLRRQQRTEHDRAVRVVPARQPTTLVAEQLLLCRVDAGHRVVGGAEQVADQPR